ncbi:MAG: glycosyltransferase [Oscillospiraceae bacterium]|nr:glycosyltransferase [Oscillospiraceae bacterium]
MKLSIIVPVYKVEPYLRRCVDSILSQTFTDLELILVDDGSPDGCPAICDEYAEKDCRVKVIHKENGGLSDARNAGLDTAQGEYIGFIDSDDFIHPRMYEILYRMCVEEKADIAQCEYTEFENKLPKPCLFGNDEVLTKVYEASQYVDNYFSGYWWIIGPTVCNKLFSKRIFGVVRFPVGKLFEDSNVHLDILRMTDRIAVTDSKLYYYYQRAGSIMHSGYSVQRAYDMNEICEKLLCYFEDTNNQEQIYYAEDNYLTRFLKDKFAVWEKRPDQKNEFAPIEHRINQLRWRILRNPKICRMKKFVFVLQTFYAKGALKLCRVYFPECIHPFMR